MRTIFRSQHPGLRGYIWLSAFAAAYLLLVGLVLAPQSLIGLTQPPIEIRND
jgi:hypothetical protein